MVGTCACLFPRQQGIFRGGEVEEWQNIFASFSFPIKRVSLYENLSSLGAEAQSSPRGTETNRVRPGQRPYESCTPSGLRKSFSTKVLSCSPFAFSKAPRISLSLPSYLLPFSRRSDRTSTFVGLDSTFSLLSFPNVWNAPRLLSGIGFNFPSPILSKRLDRTSSYVRDWNQRPLSYPFQTSGLHLDFCRELDSTFSLLSFPNVWNAPRLLSESGSNALSPTSSGRLDRTSTSVGDWSPSVSRHLGRTSTFVGDLTSVLPPSNLYSPLPNP